MKIVTATLVILVCACGRNSNTKQILQPEKITLEKSTVETLITEKTSRFKDYSIKTGLNNQGSYIQLIKKGAVLLERIGGEGLYNKIDTIDFNRDGFEDYIFSYLFEDYFNLGIIVSESDLKYEFKSLGDYSYPEVYCDDFEMSDTVFLHNFMVIDTSHNLSKRIIVNCLEKEGSLMKTCLTDTIQVPVNKLHP